MQQVFHGLVGWCAFLLVAAGGLQACGDSARGQAGGAGRSGGGSVGGDNGAGASPNAGGSVGAALGGSGEDVQAGAPSNAGESGALAGGGGSSTDGGATGAGGVGACHVTWSGAETGQAGCPSLHVCHMNFLSLNLGPPESPTPLRSIQLVYSPDHDLTVGTFVATGLDMVNCNAQSFDDGVSYAPQLDEDSMLTGGTSMTVTLIELSFSTDPNDVCAGTAHGSMDVVLPPTNAQAGAESLTLHAEF